MHTGLGRKPINWGIITSQPNLVADSAGPMGEETNTVRSEMKFNRRGFIIIQEDVKCEDTVICSILMHKKAM